MVHLGYIYCIIKYITARRKYLLYLSIDKNQLNQCKDWENFPQINLCFHVLYALFLLLPQHLLAGVSKTHVDMHPPPLHFHSAIQWYLYTRTRHGSYHKALYPTKSKSNISPTQLPHSLSTVTLRPHTEESLKKLGNKLTQHRRTILFCNCCKNMSMWTHC